jgi:hypothetical protein
MKRWIPIAFAAVILMMASLLAGMVLAQGGVPGSSETGPVPTRSTGGQEVAPASPAAPGPVVSSAEGDRSAVTDDATLEAPPEVGVIASGGTGSSSEAGAAAGAGLWPEETAPEGYAPANAPEYNTSIRFIGSALKPRENDVDYEVSLQGGCVYVSAGDATTVWNLPLALPEGAQVDYVRIYVSDSNAADTCGWFTRYDLYGSLDQEWAACSEGNAGNGYWTAQISPTETINYGSYSYALNWRPGVTGDTIQLCGLRLYYTAPFRAADFLPHVDK